MRRALLFSVLVFCLALAAMSFTSPTSGRGAGIAQGSSTWGRQTSGTTNELRSVHFVSENEGWVAGANATLLRTTNGGANWAAVNTGIDPASGFNSVRFLDRSTGFVGGERSLARTLNAGATWMVATGFLSGDLHNSFFPVINSDVWGAGGTATSPSRGFIHRYRFNSDGSLAFITAIFSGVGGYRDIHFIDFFNGWIVGAEGRIARRSSDFRLQSSGTNQALNGIQMFRGEFVVLDSYGWVVGDNGTILKTTNGGDTWVAQTSGTTANLLAVHFVNANRGWVVGDGGVILTTSNGGATWTPEASGVTTNLRRVFFVNETTGFAVGDNGLILKRGVPSGPTVVTTVSAASFSGAELAAESIVAAFGQGFATATEVATSVPLPTTLAGASVRVRDSAGTERAAPLFFVAPGQINYQIPPGTVGGTSNISVVRGETVIAAGTASIATVAPGLFAANANGQGVAAAVVFRRRADGSESFEPVAQFDQAQNRFVAVPIDLGPETDQVTLILFGTGIRFRSALSTVTCNIGGASAPVSFAGAQGDFVGLDQVNVSLPRSLMGRGEVEIKFTVDGKEANTGRVAIK